MVSHVWGPCDPVGCEDRTTPTDPVLSDAPGYAKKVLSLAPTLEPYPFVSSFIFANRCSNSFIPRVVGECHFGNGQNRWVSNYVLAGRASCFWAIAPQVSCVAVGSRGDRRDVSLGLVRAKCSLGRAWEWCVFSRPWWSFQRCVESQAVVVALLLTSFFFFLKKKKKRRGDGLLTRHTSAGLLWRCEGVRLSTVGWVL